MKRWAGFWGALLIPLGVVGQSDSISSVAEITVQGYRSTLPTIQGARSVFRLESETIRVTPGVSLNDVLGFVPGLDARERGPMGVQTDLSLRGGTFNQTLVLLDGLKLSDPLTGHHSLNLPIPLAAIGAIEVLKGPAARALGQNAFAGAVNIVPATGLAPTLSLTYGQYNLSHVNLTTGIQAQKSEHLFSAGYSYSDGYTENTDFGISQVFYHGRTRLSPSRTLTATAGYSVRHFGAANFYFTPSREYEITESWLAALGYRSTRTQANLYWRRHFDDYRPYREQQQTPRNKHHTDAIALEANHSLPALGGTASVGFDLRNEQIRSNNLGSHYRWTAGGYLEQVWHVGQWFLSPGAYLNYFSDFGWAAYPGLDISYRTPQDLKLYGTLGRAYRIPTYIDLYLNTSQNLGNPALNPESAWTYELGAEWQPGTWKLSAALFVRNGLDLIDYARADTATTGPFEARNVNDLTTRGLETGIAYRFSESFLKLVALNYSYLEQDNNPGNFTSRYVFDFLRHQLVASADIELLAKTLTARPVFRYEKRVNRTENYLVDLRLNYRLGRWTFFVEGTNLLNQPYADIGGAVLPGRWLRGGFQVYLRSGPIVLR